MKQLSFFFRAIVALVVAGTTLITPVNAGVDPKIPRPQAAMPELDKQEFISALVDYRNADLSVGHSQPGPFADALESILDQVAHEKWDGNKAYQVRNPGNGGTGVAVVDMKGMSATMAGQKLVRDANDKFVALYLNEDFGIYLVYDAIVFPKDVDGFMIRLNARLSPADDLPYWGKSDDEHCNDGKNRAIARQTGSKSAANFSRA